MLQPDILRRIQEQDEFKGIKIHSLPAGIVIEVQTVNSIYRIETTEYKGHVYVQGGKLPERTRAYFDGSTWGGSMLKLGWIGYNMHMEIRTDKKLLCTSPVQGAVVRGPDWEYKMDWPKNTDPQ